MFRSKVNRVVKDEKCSKYFHSQVKENFKRSNITSLELNDQVTEDPQVIEKALVDFYESLYRKREVNPHCEDWLDPLPSIDAAQSRKLDEPITMNEISNVVFKSMHKGKSPGNDGLTLGLYMIAWKFIKKRFVKIPSGKHKSR